MEGITLTEDQLEEEHSCCGPIRWPGCEGFGEKGLASGGVGTKCAYALSAITLFYQG